MGGHIPHINYNIKFKAGWNFPKMLFFHDIMLIFALAIIIKAYESGKGITHYVVHMNQTRVISHSPSMMPLVDYIHFIHNGVDPENILVRFAHTKP